MRWANLLPLLVVVALAVAYVRWIRPRIRQSRHDRWERAGLLPEQTGETQLQPGGPLAPEEERGGEQHHGDRA